MRKSFWLAVLAYLVPTFPLGYFWHLVTFADRYHRLEMYRDDVIIPLGLASMVIQALVFAGHIRDCFPPRACRGSAVLSALRSSSVSWPGRSPCCRSRPSTA